MRRVLALVLFVSCFGVVRAQSTNSSLSGRMTDPTAGVIEGAQVAATKPYPQFGNMTNLATNAGTLSYHSLQATFEKRFGPSGTLYAAYIWAKLMGTPDTELPDKEMLTRRLSEPSSQN